MSTNTGFMCTHSTCTWKFLKNDKYSKTFPGPLKLLEIMVGVTYIVNEEIYPGNTESEQSSRMFTGNKSV